jgi:hypothetical protein
VFRIRIRTKLLAALAIPLSMIVFVAVVYVGRATDDRDQANAEAVKVQQQADTPSARVAWSAPSSTAGTTSPVG